MNVYKTQEGKEIILKEYRKHLDSNPAAGLLQRTIQTPQGETFILEKQHEGKPPLLLLHGSVSNSASWLGVIPLFSKNFHVYCIDIPGEPCLSSDNRFLLSSNLPELWISNVLDGLGLHSASFLGMSLGGWYALNFAVHYPHRVSSLSLISAAGFAGQKISFLFKALFLLMLGKTGQNYSIK